MGQLPLALLTLPGPFLLVMLIACGATTKLSGQKIYSKRNDKHIVADNTQFARLASAVDLKVG